MIAPPRAGAWGPHAAWALAVAMVLAAARWQSRVRLAHAEARWRDRLHHELLPRVDAAGYAAAQGDTELAHALLTEASTSGRTLLAAQPDRRGEASAVADAVARASGTWGGRLGPTAVQIDDPLPRLTADTHRVLAEVVGEALTNVAHHRPGASVSVVLAGLDDEVLLSVTSRGGRASTDPRHRGGYGAAALERAVTAIGGTIRQQPLHDGHQVTTRVPADRAGRHAPHGPRTRHRRPRRSPRSRSGAGTT